jgi:flagellar biosynthesis GTPase FlhF
MKTIFYILSILVIGAAAYFAFDSKQKLENEMAIYEERHAENTRVAANIKATQGDLDDTTKALTSAKDRNSELTATKDSEESKERNLRATIEKYQTEIDEAEVKLAKFDEAQKEIEEALGGINVAFDQIEPEIAKLEGERKEKQKKLDELLLLEEKLQNSVNTNRGEIARLVGRLDEIRKKMTLNSVQGMVTAVDPVWGFVIVNLGEKNSNVTQQSDLLVSRNGLLLGRLTVSSLEPNQTICDVDMKAMKPGQRIQPGDSVIIAKTPGS